MSGEMATTRSRTLMFCRLRDSHRHSARRQRQPRIPAASVEGSVVRDAEAAERLIGDVGIDGVAIEMEDLSPSWTAVVEDMAASSSRIAAQLSELEKMHRKHLLPSFDDTATHSLESSIHALSTRISTGLSTLQSLLVSLDSAGSALGDQERVLVGNVRLGWAVRVQDIGEAFRSQQTKYLKQMQDRETRARRYLVERHDAHDATADTEDDPHLQASLMASADPELAAEIHRRHAAINQISSTIRELSALFRDLDRLIVDQGTVLDRVDYNMEQANIGVRSGVRELEHASVYQRRGQRMGIVALVVLLIVLIIVAWVVRRSDSSTAAAPDNGL